MGRPTRLAIVGASARAAAQSALRAGYDVVTADLFADEDLRRLCPATRIPQANYPEGLADWLAEQDVDAWMYTGALENFPDLVDRMSEIQPLWGNRGDALRRVRDPVELQRVCQEHGLQFPETRNSADGLPRDGSWLCKTYRGAGGSGVRELTEESQGSQDDPPGAVYQKYVFGMPAAVVFAIDDRQSVLLGVTEQIVGAWQLHAPEWAYCGSILRPGWSQNYRKPLAKLGGILREAFGLRGLVGADLVVMGKTMSTIEINPRYTASSEIVESACDESGVALHARCFDAREPLPTPAERVINGKAIVFARADVVVGDEFHRLALRSSIAGHSADIPAPGTEIRRGQPVLTRLLDDFPGLDRQLLLKDAARIESRLYT